MASGTAWTGGPHPALSVAVDATPLLGPMSGIGRYVRSLVDVLAADDCIGSLGLVTTSVRRGARQVPAPPGTWRRSLRVPAPVWRRSAGAGSRLVDHALRPARLWHMTNFAAPRPRHLPYTVTVHDLAYLHLPAHVSPGAEVLRHVLPRLLRGASAVVTISAATRDDLREAYPWLEAPVVPVPLGVDPAWLEGTGPGRGEATTRHGEGPGFVVSVGTREPRKNLGLLVRAHAAARAVDRDVPRLVLVGRRGWGEDLDGASARPEDVTLVEDADDGRLAELLRSARALCAPSHQEGFSLPVLEAMAAGTPVIASDIPAHRELLAGTGALLPSTDEEAWTHALLAVPEAGGPLIGAARARALEHTWQRTAAQHVDVWRTVLSESSP